MLLNLAGGDSVDDLGILDKDDFLRELGRVETKGLSRQQRRAKEEKMEKGTASSVHSLSALFRYHEAHYGSPVSSGWASSPRVTSTRKKTGQ